MLLSLIIFVLVIAVFTAELEIHIEGKDGWASSLPTWRVQSKITDFLYKGLPLTGYHMYLHLLLVSLFHLPFLTGFHWNPSNELEIISLYIFFWILEDFFWFVLNPHFGFKKFKKSEIAWHRKWFLGIPLSYWRFFFIAVILAILSHFL